MNLKQSSGKKRKMKGYQSILFKIIFSVIVFCIILLFFDVKVNNAVIDVLQYETISDMLESDMRYLRTSIGEDKDSFWSIKDGVLYLGDTEIGDGTVEHANVELFEECKNVTGIIYYAFIRTWNDDELVWVKERGYQQGHYRRVAGTRRGDGSQRLEGTYMDKKVVDALENSNDGTYTDLANVNGVEIYCHYELLYDKQHRAVGVLSNGTNIEELEGVLLPYKITGAFFFVLIAGILIILLTVVVYTILKAMKKIRLHLAVITAGEYPKEPLQLKSKDELSEVADSINEMVASLKEKERMRAELSLATDIQAHMLPRIFPPFPELEEFDIYATMEPAKEVGGDFYDFFILDDKHVAIVIADVSGKGVPAALFMVITKTLIKNYTLQGLSPADVFTVANNILAEGNERDMFVTAWMGILNTETGVLTYVNAGHNPPLMKLADEDFAFVKTRPGFVLAGMEGIRYRQNQLQMHPGDKIFLYTDGVTEAINGRKELYGEERLLAFVKEHTRDSLEELLKGVRGDISAFAAGEEQFDDITMLILDYRKSGA